MSSWISVFLEETDVLPATCPPVHANWRQYLMLYGDWTAGASGSIFLSLSGRIWTKCDRVPESICVFIDSSLTGLCALFHSLFLS